MAPRLAAGDGGQHQGGEGGGVGEGRGGRVEVVEHAVGDFWQRLLVTGASIVVS